MSLADFFRPRYKHSNPAIRAEALEDLDHGSVAIFQSVALNDPDSSVRRIAIDRLEDTKALAEVAQALSEPKLAERAKSRAAKLLLTRLDKASKGKEFSQVLRELLSLEDERALADGVNRLDDEDSWRTILDEIGDDKVLSDIARNSGSRDKRLAALEMIDDETVLRSIGLDASRKDVGVAAVDRIDDKKILDALVAKASLKAVKNAARKKLKDAEDRSASREEEGASLADRSDPRLLEAEQIQLVHKIERLAKSNEWARSKLAVTELEELWAQLAQGGSESLVKRFEGAREKYWRRRERYASPADDLLPGESHQPTPEAETAMDSVPGDIDDAETEKYQPEATAAPKTAPKRVSAEEAKRQEAARNLQIVQQAMSALSEAIESERIKAMDQARRIGRDLSQALGNLPSASEAIAEEFEALRKTALIRIGEIKEAAEWARWANVKKQEGLIDDAKKLLNSDEVEKLGSQLKRLQRAWKDVGPVPRAKNEELWGAFKEVCDQIYDKVKEQRARLNEERKENLAKKRELCEQAEALSDSEDWDATAAEFKRLQDEWKEIGPVGRKFSDKIWERFRAACDHFFERRQPHLDSKLDELTKNLEKKQALCEQAESLSDSEEWRETAQALKKLQAEWKEIGHVPRESADEINTRFRVACDTFFTRRQEMFDAKAQEHKQAIADWEAEGGAVREAIQGGEPDWDSLKEKCLSLRQAALSHDALQDKRPQYLEKVAELLTTVAQKKPELFDGTEIDVSTASERKQKLLERAKEMVRPEKDVDLSSADSASLASTLMSAMKDNAMADVLKGKAPDGRPIKAVVEELKDAWLRLGPAVGDVGAKLEQDFKETVAKLLADSE